MVQGSKHNIVSDEGSAHRNALESRMAQGYSAFPRSTGVFKGDYTVICLNHSLSAMHSSNGVAIRFEIVDKIKNK